MIKVKAYLLTLLSILLLSACRSTAETPQLDLNDGGKGLELTARSTGDTLYIPFSSSVTDERLQITEAEDWIETELRRGQLLVYAARIVRPSPAKQTHPPDHRARRTPGSPPYHDPSGGRRIAGYR